MRLREIKDPDQNHTVTKKQGFDLTGGNQAWESGIQQLSTLGEGSFKWDFSLCENTYYNVEYIARAFLPFPIAYVQKAW